MKSSIISGIILILITGLAAKFIFNDKIELRYILSERIPTTFIDGNDSESIQQLEILNTGVTEIQKIIIKIHAEILDYDVLKVASTDSVQILKTNESLEIIYPNIPPKAGIKIILKSSGQGVSENSISINHSKGIAKKVFEKGNSLNFVPIALAFIYLILITFIIRSITIDSFNSDINYKPYDKILKRKRPWFVSAKKWQDIRNEALGKIYNQDTHHDIKTSLSYQILDIEKPELINDEEWIKLKIEAHKKIISLIAQLVNQSYNWSIEEILTIKKPKNLEDVTWKEIKTIIGKAYITKCILNIRNYNSKEEIEQQLKAQKPEIINIEDWDRYQTFLNKFNDLNNSIELNKQLEKIFFDLIYNKKLKEKPDILEIKEWNQLKKFEKEIFEKYESIEEELAELYKLKNKLEPLKEKLEKQLKIINNLFDDPKSISRIEDYSNPFNSGNFENLKKLSSAMIDNEKK